MKQTIKLYLESKDVIRLKQKASACGFNGRGCLSYYITRIAREPIVFLSEDMIQLLKGGK